MALKNSGYKFSQFIENSVEGVSKPKFFKQIQLWKKYSFYVVYCIKY